jgi:hypothetical protein
MTTVQDSTNGHHALPPPCSAENPADLNSAGLPTHKDNNNQFPASAYHVPPKLYAPKADSFRDTIPDGLTTMKMPDRCQFMFSDGRQCTMARSDIHPSLCVYHSEREEQLFGTPHTRGLVRGPSFDLPELFSASRDLTTAAGVNGAVGQVFRLLAQRRISRQEAATFAKLAHLLLQSIRAAQAEADVARAEFNAIQDQPSGVYESSGVIPSSGESLAANVYLQDELRGANKDHQELSPVNSSGESHGHHATPLKSTHTKMMNLKLFRISTYTKFAANVMDIRSFAALTNSAAIFVAQVVRRRLLSSQGGDLRLLPRVLANAETREAFRSAAFQAAPGDLLSLAAALFEMGPLDRFIAQATEHYFEGKTYRVTIFVAIGAAEGTGMAIVPERSGGKKWSPRKSRRKCARAISWLQSVVPGLDVTGCTRAKRSCCFAFWA